MDAVHVPWSRQVWRAQRELPWVLCFPILVPLTFILVTALGLFFPLPPGPLCDEGMVLFMEGGCDWGGSNIFFYSKVGLLVAANVAFGVCLARPPRALLGFLPHLALLVAMGLLFSQSGCDTYYDHPNGSIGQMCLELAAFSAWGLALLGFLQGRPAWMRVLAVPLWNASHVGLFYAGLAWTSHWTWAHTGFVVGSQAVLACALGWWCARARLLIP